MDKFKTKTTLLVFDFGGGTLDVSVIEIDNEKFNVKGIEGDSFLGGRDFDKKLFEFFFPDAINMIFNEGGRRAQEHFLRVKKNCIKIKKQLSTKKEVSLYLDHFGRNEHESIPLTITRENFEILCKDLFTRATDLIIQCMSDLELTKNDIDEVLLVGGTTRIPKVHEVLQSYFENQKLKRDLNPDAAVALGAAVQAAILQKSNKELEKYKITDVTPLTLGFELDGGLMRVVIKKNSTLPIKSQVVETRTCKNNQKSCKIDIYEGERKNCRFNTLLATLNFENLPPGRAGDVHFNTTFNLNEDGILEVESCEPSEDKKRKIALTTHDHRLSQKKIKSALEEAQKYKKQDDNFEKVHKYRKEIRKYCNYILYDLDKISDREERNKVERYCNEVLHYTDNVDDKTMKDLRSKFKDIRQEVDSIIMNKIAVNFNVLCAL